MEILKSYVGCIGGCRLSGPGVAVRRNHSLDRGSTIPSLSLHLSISHYFFFLCLWICLFICNLFFLCLCMRMSVFQNGSAKSNLTLANPQIIVFPQ